MRLPIERQFFIIACSFGFLGVAFGAFGAHALKGILSSEQLAIFEVGVRYQMYHTFALLAVAMALTRWPGKHMRASGWLFIIGIILFSGSLYAMVFSGVRALGIITPIGGLAFLMGWLCLGIAVWKSDQRGS